MPEELSTTGGSVPDQPRCPWCSAELRSADVARCPSCGAIVREDPAAEAPGLTRIDPEAVLRARLPQPRSRGILGWLSGEVSDAPGPPVAHETIAPPPNEVRAEILRMELAVLQAEAAAAGALAALEAAGTAAGAPATTGDGVDTTDKPTGDPPA